MDWWSVGILLYEMLCGITPFRHTAKAELKRMITQQKLKFTKSADGASYDPHAALPGREYHPLRLLVAHCCDEDCAIGGVQCLAATP